MTTPQQPGVDPQRAAEVIEDLPVPADSVQQVAGGALEGHIKTTGQQQSGTTAQK